MNPEDFALSEAELDATFSKEIIPWLFGKAEPSEVPLLMLIGAQPGAGKTRASRDAVIASGQKIVSIIGDDLRAFHPEYQNLLKMAPADMPAATAQASAGWVERSIEFAAESRISVLVEGTFRNAAVTSRTAHRFKGVGFRVEATLVAVAPEVSRASIAGRFVYDARRHNNARFTPLKAHNDAYMALPVTVAALSVAGSPVDRLIVRNRETILFDKQRKNGQTIHGALKAAGAEWNRTLTAPEFDQLVVVQDDAASYFAENFPTDPEASLLSDQMVADREFAVSKRSGVVYVRGHRRGESRIQAYARSRQS